jgi:hypothetical protein
MHYETPGQWYALVRAVDPDVLPSHLPTRGTAIGQEPQKWARKPPDFSRGMNGLSVLRTLLRNGMLSTWRTRMTGTTSTWWCTTSIGVPSDAGRC